VGLIVVVEEFKDTYVDIESKFYF